MWLDELSAQRSQVDPDADDPFAPPDPRVGTIYLIHLRKRMGHAQHYCGFTTDLKRRIKTHKAGGVHAARLLAAAKDAGITWSVVATWTGTREDERRMKRNNDLARTCPKCREKVLRRKAAQQRRVYAARKAAEECVPVST